MTPSTTHILDARSDFACFSRPELKVERWSYPCPTPSAARGVFEAVYFKPQFYWQLTRIELLSWPSYIALRRNEVGHVASTSNIKTWMKDPSKASTLLADDPSVRQQRQTMALRGPHFRLHARIVPRPGFEGEQTAFDSQFARRASQGKCFTQPYLGCREFVAFFQYMTDLSDEPAPVDYSQDIGWMLYDVFDLSQVNRSEAQPFITLFKARIANGVLNVPPFDGDDVLKPERADTQTNKKKRRAG